LRLVFWPATMGINRDSWHKRSASGAKRTPIRMKRKFELGRQPAMTKIGERRVRPVRCRGGNTKFRALRLDHGNFCWPGEAVTRKTRILSVAYNAVSNELVRTNTLVKGAIIYIDGTPFKMWYQKHYGVAIGAKEEVKKKHARALRKEAAKKPKITKTAIARAKKRASTKPATTPKPKPTTATTTATTPATTPATTTTTTEKKSQKGKDKKEKTKKTPRPGRTGLRLRRLRNKTRVLEPLLADFFEKGKILARIASRPGQVGRADGYLLEGEELAFYQKKISLKKKK